MAEIVINRMAEIVMKADTKNGGQYGERLHMDDGTVWFHPYNGDAPHQRRSIDELGPDHQDAVRRFAAKHGKDWKDRLADAWGMGTDVKEHEGWALRDLRNSPAWGHHWLENVEDVA